MQKGIAEVTERALRGEITKKDEDKLQVLKEKYRWPANIANMQIPKIEQFMWKHLKKETRTSDVVQIKVLENYSYSLTTDQSLGLVSSPEHEVLMVSYCGQSVSVVRYPLYVVNNCFKSLLLLHPWVN